MPLNNSISFFALGVALSVSILSVSVSAPAAAAESPKKETAKAGKASGKTAAAAPAAKDPARDAKGKETGKDTKPKDGNSLKQVFQESPTEEGGPLYVKSDTLELNSKDRVFTYKGNVEVVRNDLTITSNTVEGHYDGENKLQTIVAIGNVVITKGETMRSTANRAVYNVAAATIELTEGPELYREGNALAADKVTMFINEDRSEAEGNVRVKVVKPEEAGQ